MIGTIDDEILTRLYRRINIFEKYIGDLDAILGDQITELTREIFNIQLTLKQKIQKIDFNQEITHILKTKRFITSDEVVFLLRLFLERNFPKTTLLPPKSKRQNIFVLKCNYNFRQFIRQYAVEGRNYSPLKSI